MTFLFVAGVEGAGHDMLRAVLKEAFDQPTMLVGGDWRKPLVNYWEVRSRYQQEFGVFRQKNRSDIQHKLNSILNHYRKMGVTHLLEDMSFPFYQPRSAIRRPDLLDLKRLLPDYIRFKVLVLYRNPVSAAYSGVRRNFTKNVYEQARIVEDNLIYIDRQVTVGLNGNFRSLVFEDFLREPRAFLTGLAEWLEVDKPLLEKGLTNLREPFAIENIPTKIHDVLTSIFTAERARLWENLYSSKYQISRT